MSQEFCFDYFIPFHLADPSGILFFGHIFTLAHQAYEQFVMQKIECPWSEWFQHQEWCIPIKHAEAQFINPLSAGQICKIHLNVESASVTSFVLAYSLTQNEKLCCTAKTVHVFCNRLTMQKMAIPLTILPYLKNLN